MSVFQPGNNGSLRSDDDTQVVDPITSLRQLSAFDPTNVDTLIDLGAAYYDNRQFSESLDAYRAAYQLAPNHPIVLYNLSRIYADLNDAQKSRQWAERAVDANPTDPDFWYNFGCVFDGYDDTKAEQGYLQAVGLDTSYLDAIVNLGILYKRIGDLDAAIQQYTKALELAPEDSGVYYVYGNALRAKQEFDKAVSAYREALRFDCAYVDAWNNLSLTLIDLKQYHEAVSAAESGLALAPEDPVLHSLIAAALEALGDDDRAIEEYYQSLDYDPFDIAVAVRLSDLLIRLQRYDEVVEFAAALLVKVPGELELILVLTEALDELGKYDEAETYYQAGIDLFPNNPQLHHNYALCLSGMQRYPEALAECRRAIELEPSKTSHMLLLGQLYRKAGSFNEAIATLQQALNIERTSVILYELGVVYDDIGETELARDYWRQSSESKPDKEVAELAARALNNQ